MAMRVPPVVALERETTSKASTIALSSSAVPPCSAAELKTFCTVTAARSEEARSWSLRESKRLAPTLADMYAPITVTPMLARSTLVATVRS
jgi:hypothetical protein